MPKTGLPRHIRTMETLTSSPMKTDTAIRRTLLGMIRSDEILKTNDIAVDVNQGVVTLKGCVRNMQEKRVAERLAKRIREVKAIALDLRVECPEADDDT